MRYLASTVALAAFIVVSPARADETRPASSAVAPSDELAPSKWYGWQTLTTDGASAAVLAGAAAAKNSPLGYVSLGGYLFGAPVVHFAHGNPGRGVGSLALRMILPSIGFAFGYAAFHRSDRSEEWFNFSGLAEGMLFGLGGVASCVALDASVFSYERAADASDAQAPARARYKVSVSPQIGYVRGGALAGMGGTF